MRLDDWFEWHVASRPMADEPVSGDGWVAVPCSTGVLLAVVDGLGHGPQAAEAASRACDALRHAPDDRLDETLRQCHAALRGTRGAALSMALVHRLGGIAWLGIGNVEAVIRRRTGQLQSTHDTLMLLPGVVGYQIPQVIRPHETDFGTGDLLVMATDGIHTAFIDTLSVRDDADHTAQRVLGQYAKENDDALVLAAAIVKGTP